MAKRTFIPTEACVKCPDISQLLLMLLNCSISFWALLGYRIKSSCELSVMSSALSLGLGSRSRGTILWQQRQHSACDRAFFQLDLSGASTIRMPLKASDGLKCCSEHT